MMETIASLQLGSKLLPWRNPDISWFWVFLIALVSYLSVLMQVLNKKPLIGSVQVLSPAFQKLLYPNTPMAMEIIAQGGVWTEGPLWIEDEASSLNYLLYSDTRQNAIFRWEEGKGMFTVGKTLYIPKSGGCRTSASTSSSSSSSNSNNNNSSSSSSNKTSGSSSCSPQYCSEMFEVGSNGLLRMQYEGLLAPSTAIDIIACQHGERAVGLLRENGTRSFIATHYQGKRLNSPNDVVWSPEGNLYFTDPTYGLHSKASPLVPNSELQELQHSGVYMILSSDVQEAAKTGIPTNNVYLLDDSLTKPNGLAFSPDFSKLFVSNSDPNDAYWKVYDVKPRSGMLGNGKVFLNVTEMLTSGQEKFGSPDGFKIDINGNLFATGPGGVLVISPEAEVIGRFRLDRPVSNVAFGSDKRIYFSASDLIVRMWINTKPARIAKRNPNARFTK